MTVNVKLFAAAKDLIGDQTITVELPEGATVGDLRSSIATQYPNLANLLQHTMIAVNTEYAGDNAAITEGDEVACIPPVSGG